MGDTFEQAAGLPETLTASPRVHCLDVSQVFAGYVLHAGPMPSSLKVGDKVFCEADGDASAVY